MSNAPKRKLIEVALPLDVINRESAREKSIRHGHPSTLHLWWARRPLAAARAVLWASLVDDPSSHPDRFPTVEDQERERRRLFGILEELVRWENSLDERVLSAAREEILRSTGGNPPPVLDPFCGGGTIPLEAQRLGLKALGGDLNPVAVLISKAMVEIPPRFAGLPPVNPVSRAESGLRTWERAQGLAEDVRYYGEWMRERAWERIGHLYPKVELPPEEGGGEATVIAWIWARTVKSPDPSWNGHVPLVRSWVLSKKPGKPVVWVEPLVDYESQTISYRIRKDGTPPEGTIARSQGRCVATGTAIADEYIKQQAANGGLGATLIAVVADGPRERVYAEANANPQIAHVERSGLPPVPSLPLSTHPQYMGPPRYGMPTTADLFTFRQLLMINTLADLVAPVRRQVKADAETVMSVADDRPLHDGGTGPGAYADAIATYLALAVSKGTNLWSSLTSWMGDRGALRETFPRQALPMVWDFAEANPFSEAGGSWSMVVRRVAAAVDFAPCMGGGTILHEDARRLLSPIAGLVSTDPPYYDQVPYADISDFFYVWLRQMLRLIWPSETSTLTTPKAEELVADTQRHRGRKAATEYFERGMQRVLSLMSSQQDQSVPATIYYSYKQVEGSGAERGVTGWESFLSALLKSGLTVIRTWPIRTEGPGRIRALGAAALASSIVLVCRPRSVDAPLATRGEFLAALRAELPEAVRLLQAESIAPVDLAQSAIGPGMAVFSRYSKVVEADGSPMTVRAALALINEVLDEVLAEEESEFDADTRWALTWYEQFGLNPGPYGDAETLSKAKDTSVAGVAEAGIVVSRDGKVRLKDRSELDPDWDPGVDRRSTVWEATHHLIRRLEVSEVSAAELLMRLGAGYGDRARQLAYRLYQISERKGWAKEAVAYNGLIVTWPELARLATSPATSPEQQTLEVN